MSRPEKKEISGKKIGALILAAAVVAGGAFGIHKYETRDTEGVHDTSKDVYEIEGIECTKKQNIETYLVMGTDEREVDNRDASCSDTNILLVIDRKENTYSMLPLDRDAMVEFTVKDENGEVFGQTICQLALTHAIGDGGESSCENTRDAVSNLLQNQYINGYAAINMDSIGKINHILGGVDVKIADEFDDGSGLAPGQTVHLNDKQAESYVRSRKEVGDGTNENRMKRQEAYLDGAVNAFKEKCLEDNSFVNNAMNEMRDCMVTNMTNAQFSKVAKALEGNTKVDVPKIKYTRTINENTELAEVRYDQESLNYAIIKLFYDPVDPDYFEAVLED